jgi:hypothetical protein
MYAFRHYLEVGLFKQADFFISDAEPVTSLLNDLLHTADAVLVKKLSNNDRDWAQFSNKHQAGVYIPPSQRDSGFFPALVTKARTDGREIAIREIFFETLWPQVGEKKRTRLVHYTSKGAETHMTGVPKAAFATLLPSSWLIMGRYNGEAPRFECLTVDADSDDAHLLEDTLGIGPEFVAAIFEPREILAAERAHILDFAEHVAIAWTAGDIAAFATGRAAMPTTAELAILARGQYLSEKRLPDMNPFAIDNPGDVIRDISRGTEWELFREFQRRERAVEVVRSILGDTPFELTAGETIRRVVNGIADIDRIMLSASQQRKSRAGYSFEHHIEAMLHDGVIPFEKQVIMEAKKRPDFVLPSARHLSGPASGPAAGLILSAKTTLRERWKQVQREMTSNDLFLATVDESIAANAIEDMASLGITLVVPESLKKSKSTEYVRHDNVIDFRTFFREELAGRRIPAWTTT